MSLQLAECQRVPERAHDLDKLASKKTDESFPGLIINWGVERKRSSGVRSNSIKLLRIEKHSFTRLFTKNDQIDEI